MKKGYIHVYTGNGKGKTTAAFGLAVRALSAGKTVFIGQFVKEMKYGETILENLFEGIEIEQFGTGCFINRSPEQADIDSASLGFDKCADFIRQGSYDMIILDEILIALFYGLIREEDVLRLLADKASHIEIVLTGRYATPRIIEVADLVTEMQEVKHYYNDGILSRKGIEF